MAFIVFDMDGTLSDPSARVHHLENNDWDSFYDECDADTPKEDVLLAFNAHIDAGHTIMIWTGRRESCRIKTIEWLQAQNIDMTDIHIAMRADKDHRHDTEVKGEWIAQYGRPDLVYEDRNSMVDFYRSQGITCVQVAEGDF